MMYEVVITRTQPPCGGKPTQEHEIRTAEVTDFVDFVRKNESDMPADFPLEAVKNAQGIVVVDFESGQSHITYEFTED